MNIANDPVRKIELSLVVPVYNEEECILGTLRTLTDVACRVSSDRYEIVLIDDGSNDSSFRIISDAAVADPRIKCVRLSRNFGAHGAAIAGLKHASGNAVAIIAADLQDPPELLLEMAERWRAGAHAVWAIRESRRDAFIDKLYSGLFYRVFRAVAIKDFPPGGMDFGLFDRKVIDAFLKIPERNAVVSGSLFWLGFRAEFIPYTRRERILGKSKWNFRKKIRLALNFFVAFSHFPLRIASYCGIFCSLAAFCYAALILTGAMLHKGGIEGWASTIIVVLVLGGTQLLTLGIIGEYLWRISDQVKGRPDYAVMETIGFEHDGKRNT